MNVYLVNGTSQSMLRDPNMKQIPYSLSEKEFSELLEILDFESVIGHEELAQFLSEIFGMDIKYNRKGIQVTYDDCLLLVSLAGRLPEHPTIVDYSGRLNYSFIRFEKQSTKDFANTLSLINQLKEK